MKLSPKLLVLAVILLLASLAGAQTTTTYTTTTDACGGKASQYCTLSVSSNPDNGVTQIVLDSRSSYPAATLYIGGWALNPTPGTLAGFNANPDGTHNPYYGAGSFESNDGTTAGTFQFYAYYISTCAGRGCGGTLGWHFRILTGSTITVTQ